MQQSITKKVTRQLIVSFRQMQFQGIVHFVEPEVAPFGAHISTKGSYVDPRGKT